MTLKQSASSRRRWDRPGAREEHAKRMSEAAATARFTKPRRGYSIGERKQIVAVIPAEAWEALNALALEQQKPMAELIRTYIEWGLEAEGVEI